MNLKNCEISYFEVDKIFGALDWAPLLNRANCGVKEIKNVNEVA